MSDTAFQVTNKQSWEGREYHRKIKDLNYIVSSSHGWPVDWVKTPSGEDAR